jgi:hypothetical protein
MACGWVLLLREYSGDNVVVCYVDQLDRFVGPETKVLAIQTSHITMAPVVNDPSIIERLTPLIVPYSHVRHKDSTDKDNRIADPIIGLETGSPKLFNTFMKRPTLTKLTSGEM